MDIAQKIINLRVPEGIVDAVLDTDTFNEIDDQFAVAYMLRSKEKIRVQAMYAAPFLNYKVTSPEEGMEASFQELKKIIGLCEETVPAFRGSGSFLPDESTPVDSPAARDLSERAKRYSPEHPLYVVAIGAITNVASAILLDPSITENMVVVWLGGHALHYRDTCEFNMKQDVAAARVVFGCGVPLVQLPCMGVVSEFHTSKPELLYWFSGKNSLSDYLSQNVIEMMDHKASGTPWSKVIWDVTAVAWLLNDGDCFMKSRLEQIHMPGYDHHYTLTPDEGFMRYIYSIHRDALMKDLIQKITE